MCIIVPGCIAAIADSIMRRRVSWIVCLFVSPSLKSVCAQATDRPSEVCSHLMGQSRDGRQLGIYGFGIGVAGFAQQTDTIEIHTPELHIARTAVLDYFQSPQQRKLSKIFTWCVSVFCVLMHVFVVETLLQGKLACVEARTPLN